MKLLLTLGPGLEPAPHGDVVILDWNSREIVDQHRYRHQVYEESHKGLAGADWMGDRLLVATEAELLEFTVSPLKLQSTRSFHFLNDVHHVAASNRRVWVCNTGLDCVEELDREWNPLRVHHLVKPFGRNLSHVSRLMLHDLKKSWSRLRGRNTYYKHLAERPGFRNVRKLFWENAFRRNGRESRYSDYRPHFLHPNHLLPVGDDIWVTLFSTGQLVSLRSGTVLADGLGRPHDGIIADDRLYFTDYLNARVIVYEFDATYNRLGVRLLSKSLKREGFLRGLAAVDNTVFVGFTALRGTPVKERYARVVALSAETLEPIDEWRVPSEFGSSLFSILHATPHYSGTPNGGGKCR